MKIAHRRRKERDRKRSQNHRESVEKERAPLDRDDEDAYTPRVYEVPKKWMNNKEDG